MRVKWLDFALSDLDSIEEYIARKNPGAAVRVVLSVIAAVELLVEQPGLGRTGRVEGTKEIVLTDIPYTVAYRIKNERVEVLRVLHQARQWPAKMV